MKKIIRLTESDLTRIVKRVISERDFSPNVVKYDRNMRGGEDPFRQKIVPKSKYNEGDIVTVDRYEREGEVVGVEVDYEKNRLIYLVTLHGRTRPGRYTEDELS